MYYIISDIITMGIKLSCHIPILNVVAGPIPRSLVAATDTVTAELALIEHDDVMMLISPLHTPWSHG